MIKKVLVLATFALITLPAIGGGYLTQSDGFFNSSKTTRSEPLEGIIPEQVQGGLNFNFNGSAWHESLENEIIEQTPLGNAILPLSILGLSYLFAKSKRKEETI